MTRAQKTYSLAIRAGAATATAAGFLLAAGLTVRLVAAASAGLEVFSEIALKMALATIACVAMLMVTNVVLKIRDEREAARDEQNTRDVREAALELARAPLDPALQSRVRSYANDMDRLERAIDGFNEPDRARILAFLLSTDIPALLEQEAAFALRKWQRVRAALFLGWLGSVSSIPILADNMNEDDNDIAFSAAEALASFNDSGAYRALLEALIAGHRSRTRLCELIEVSPLTDPLPLIQEYSSTTDTQVRYWLAYLLRSVPEKGATSLLLDLSADADSNVRARAIESLGEAGTAPVDALRRLLGDDVWYVRAQAAAAVGRCGALELTGALLPLLRDDQWWVRQDAALALAALGQEAVPEISSMLYDRDRFARNKAAEILGRLGIVEKMVNDLTSPARASEARRFLLAIGRAEAITTLNDAFDQADSKRKVALADILGEVGDARSLPALKKTAESGPSQAAQAAEEAANKIEGSDASIRRVVNE